MNNPYGSYTRHNTTTAENMAALWKEVAREHAARSSSARRYARACHDSMDAAVRRANKAERALASAEFDAATHRAARDAAEEERDEAVQERDELRQTRRRLLGKVDQLEVKLRDSGGGGQAPALTPDAITDEMVERGARQYIEEDYASWVRSPALAKSNARESVRGILEAALTEPEPRPDGAEEIEAVLRDEWTFSDEDGGEDAFADLAERLASRGVRVTTEEEARHATDE